MGKLANKVFEERATRNSVRSAFDARLSQVKTDVEARGVGGRIADRVSEEAREAYEEVLAVAGDNKGVVAGTIAALAIWFLRNPLIASLDRLLIADTDEEEELIDDGH